MYDIIIGSRTINVKKIIICTLECICASEDSMIFVKKTFYHCTVARTCVRVHIKFVYLDLPLLYMSWKCNEGLYDYEL